MEEIWKAIPGYEGLYEISTTTEIKSLPRNGTSKSEKILTQNLKINKSGYKKYEIGLHKNNIRKWFVIARLMALTFLDNPENKPCVNHIDGNPLNNRLDNLEWCSYSENGLHAYKTGLHKVHRGEQHSQNKLTDKEVLEIRELKGKMYHREIAEKFGISRVTITNILNNKNWIHI